MGRGKHEESWRLIEVAHTILAEINPATVRAVLSINCSGRASARLF